MGCMGFFPFMGIKQREKKMVERRMKDSVREMTIKIHSWKLKKLGSFWERNERFKNMFEGEKDGSSYRYED